MLVLDVTEVKLERLDLNNLHPHAWKPHLVVPETIGVTTILRYIAVSLGTLQLHPEDITDPTLMPWRMLLGMGWEAMMVQLYPEMNWQPKPLSAYGVSGHPDGYSFVEVPQLAQQEEFFVVDECKFTAKSLREKGAPKDQLKDIRREWMWVEQVKSYLAMAKKTLPYFKVNPDAPLLARFHVMWAMGAYEKYTLEERYLRYLVQFTNDEVERNWSMLQNNKEGAIQWATRHKA